MKEKICFLGKSKDFILARKLCDIVCSESDVNFRAAVVEKGFDISEVFDVFVYEFGTEPKDTLTQKVYTYSVGQSDADICGFNFQTRETSRSLEILSGNFMGRVNIPVNSEFTEASVLYCAAGLMGSGVPVPEIIKAINLKIS